MFKFCPNCTKETAPGWKCCPYCGFKTEEVSVTPEATSANSALDDALGNLMDLANERQTEDKLRVLIIRGMYDEAKALCNSLIDTNPMDQVGYIGLIRIASKNYKEYEGDEIAEQIRIAGEICGADGLLFDSEYANYISARKHFFEKLRRDFEIEDGILKKYNGKDSNVFIPHGVTSIGEVAFYFCQSLTGVTLPDSVTSIAEAAFCGCRSLTGVTLSNNIKSIAKGAFAGCESLKSITIPNSVTSIGEEAFSGCRSLTNVNIPKGVISIAECAFAHCESLKSITIPNSVTSIQKSAFFHCISLTSITIPNSVTSIANMAFAYCSLLMIIMIADSVTHIGDEAFVDCTSLTNVSIPGNCRYESNSFPEGCKIIKR